MSYSPEAITSHLQSSNASQSQTPFSIPAPSHPHLLTDDDSLRTIDENPSVNSRPTRTERMTGLVLGRSRESVTIPTGIITSVNGLPRESREGLTQILSYEPFLRGGWTLPTDQAKFLKERFDELGSSQHIGPDDRRWITVMKNFIDDSAVAAVDPDTPIPKSTLTARCSLLWRSISSPQFATTVWLRNKVNFWQTGKEMSAVERKIMMSDV